MENKHAKKIEAAAIFSHKENECSIYFASKKREVFSSKNNYVL